MRPLGSGLGFAIALAATGCGGGLDDPRAAEIASTLARADASLIRTRPALVAGKYARMAGDPYAFYRGTVPLFRHDWEMNAEGVSASAFAVEAAQGPLPEGLSTLLVGDAHPENFGALRARDGSFGLEPNDFDGADFGPYLWDLRRLTAGVSVAARLSNTDDPEAAAAAQAASRSIARAAADSYAAAIHALAGGAPRARITDGGGEVVIDDVFSRSEEDTAAQADFEGTDLVGGKRTLKRGALDPEAPYQALGDLPPQAYAALPDAIEAYRQTLIAPPPKEFFTLLDAARSYGSGVASWPKVRVILLVRGPTDDPGDDVLLELKELGDAGLAKAYPPGVFFADNPARVRAVSRAVWAIPDADPLWGTTQWLGLDCQIKTESEGQKTVRVKRLSGKRGTPEAITGLARVLGTLLARVHAASLDQSAPAAVIDAAIGSNASAFADEQADVGDAYAARVLADHQRFVTVLDELGPRLGIPFDPADTPSPDLAALYGTPPLASP
ncbi:Hypothetical protein A7982_00114 [Minicystis rosea]|nr:Hypothetical protein A7982_00114 [Minicystis rosea]